MFKALDHIIYIN